jgi:hypothetical protein
MFFTFSRKLGFLENVELNFPFSQRRPNAETGVGQMHEEHIS